MTAMATDDLERQPHDAPGYLLDMYSSTMLAPKADSDATDDDGLVAAPAVART